MTTKLPASAVIIGAGFAGLATAALLAYRGVQVTVVERNSTVGGRSGLVAHDGFRWDTGPSWYLMPEAFDHFFALLGTSTEEQLDLVDLEPGYRFFPEGETPIDVPANATAAMALFEEIEPGAGIKLRDYLNSAADIYQLAIDRFLYNNFTSPRAFIHPAVLQRSLQLISLLTQSLNRFVAQRFNDHRLRQMLTYPAVFLSAHPDQAPALYHLMSHTDLNQGVKYPQGGFTAVVTAIEHLARYHGAEFIFNADVEAITTTNNQATGVRLTGGKTIEAEVVISAADLHHTETRLLPATQRSYSERYFHNQDPGIGAVLILLGVKGKLPELLHHNLLLSRDWTKDFDAVFASQQSSVTSASHSVYVSMPSATDPTVAPDGYENLFVLIPVPAHEHFGHGDLYHDQASTLVATIAADTIARIADWTGITDLPDRIVTQHTLGPSDFAQQFRSFCGGALGPAHILRQSAFLRGKNVSRKVAGLYYAGATTVPGVGVPMCLISAENVLKRLIGDTSPHQL